MIDNFKLVSSFIPDREEGIFYHLQVIRRGKDHPELAAANRTIMQYFVTNSDYYNNIIEEVKTLCELFKARAYVNLSPKSIDKSLKMLVFRASERVYNGDSKKPWKIYSTIAGELKSSLPRWVVDIDSKDINYLGGVKDAIISIYGSNNPDILIPSEVIYTTIPTKNGYHLITKPFNLQTFKAVFPNIDVHKNNPTLLYSPKSLD